MSAFDLKGRFEILRTQLEAIAIIAEKPQCAEVEMLQSLVDDIFEYTEKEGI